MDAIVAEEILREGKFLPGKKAIYDLTLAATGSVQLAKDAKLAYIEREMEAERKPRD